jgi:lipoprotein-anchoring transpeptidase ErfK/SrfK
MRDGKRRKRKLAVGKCVFVVLALIAIIFCGIRAFGFIWGILDSKLSHTMEQGQTIDMSATKQGGSIENKALDDNVQILSGKHDYSILIVKSEYKLYLLDNGKKVAVWPCAIGKGGLGQKHKSGDNMTPVGDFFVDDINNASTWTHDFGDGKGSIKNAYGPWFISINTESVSEGKWDGIGIHGTHDPSSIGTDASEGCVRLNNENLLKLRKYVKTGTKVIVKD